MNAADRIQHMWREAYGRSHGAELRALIRMKLILNEQSDEPLSNLGVYAALEHELKMFFAIKNSDETARFLYDMTGAERGEREDA